MATMKNIKQSILDQLAVKGADVEHYVDLVEDYMKFWKVKGKLQADIKNRGVVYEDYSSVGVKMMKNNPSIKELVMVNKQMLMILKELGISTTNVNDGDGGDL